MRAPDMQADTIAALATPPGRGGIAIVRVSGERARACFDALFRPAGAQALESHRMRYGHLYDGDALLDECMAVLFLAPRSYTREDVCEFHLHGGAQAAKAALSALFRMGVRPAEPGEFTRRAFLNGRIDLSRAEAVMDVINAQSEIASRAALRQLEGGASAFIRKAQNELTDMLAGVAAAIDYPEEIDEGEAAGGLAPRARALADTLNAACDERAARFVDEGLHVVLCGLPNVGKSSLLNALLGEERAIVTDIPGTTRDIVEGDAQINGLRVRFSDTAGIRENAGQVEKIGVERARSAVKSADLTLLVLDASRPLTDADAALLNDTQALPRLILLNKCDLPAAFRRSDALPVSARTLAGIGELRARISAFAALPKEMPLTSQRHMLLARKAAAHLTEAAGALEAGQPLDIAAIDLNAALDALGEVTGDRVDEKLLDSVFEKFCVGK